MIKPSSFPRAGTSSAKKQQIACYHIIMGDPAKLIEPQELLPFKRILLTQYLLGLDEDFMNSWEEDCRQNYKEDGYTVFLSELDAILETCDFLFEKVEEESTVYQLKLGLTKCPWPKITYTNKKKVKVYYAPADELENVQIYELGTTFTLFEEFIQTGKEELIDELIATLYRPSQAWDCSQ